MLTPKPLFAAGLLAAGLLPLGGVGPAAWAPCLRPTRAGTEVQGEVRVCPGRYRVPDPTEIGVLVVVSSGTRIDLTGVTLESGDSVASRLVGAGIVSKGVDRVSLQGGVVRGYRYGVRLEGGRGHRVSGMDVSGSRAQALRSTPERYDERDWLDIFRPDTFEAYGSGVYLKWTDGASVTGVTARGAQNGIGLFGSRGAFIADNDVSKNSGWGIHLWSSAHNTIVRNKAHDNVRCESAAYSRGCDSAALLLREQSDSNLIAENDLTRSGDGFFLSGHRPLVRPSVGNVVVRNDGSKAYHNAFESTFSWGNSFLDNRADSSAYGFWLGYSTGNVVQGNTVIGSRETAIAVEHGSDNLVSGNVVIGGKLGLHLFAPSPRGGASRGYRVDDNIFAKVDRGAVLERTSQVRLRGNVFDGVGDALTVDSVGRGAEVTGNVFLRARGWFIDAPELAAGGNFWSTPSADSAAARVRGRVTVRPWRSASEAGY